MLSESSLTSIANKYGTDKGTEGPVDDWPGHLYTDIYEAYLWPLRHREIRILEIGLGVKGSRWEAHIAQGRNVSGGASIKMWAEYFPRAQVFGIDVNPASHLDTDRIKTFVADQGDPDQLRKAVEDAGPGDFDVIIDDGSHRADHQQIAFGALFERLRSGGLYFIEDLIDNGIGDPDSGRFSSDIPVLNTRRVFQTLAETGTLGTPNAIGDAAEVVARIEWVHFHAPARRTRFARGYSLKRPIQPVARFQPRSERMCVLQRS